MSASAESAIFIGCMSGTSMDGLDSVAVRFSDHGPSIEQLAHAYHPYPEELATALRRAALAPADIDTVCDLDARLGEFYAKAVDSFVEQAALPRELIGAIGLHGQTLRHNPDATTPYTLQIGDGHRVAARCGLTVVTDFRRRDLALGGQGAPLTPAFHAYAFRKPGTDRAIVNIGGISNVTLLPGQTESPITGFDCGPGNCLIDHLARKHFNLAYDEDGRLAASGHSDKDWVDAVLQREPFFQRPPPKSTGTDYFSPEWLLKQNLNPQLSASDQLATVTELTAASIAHAVNAAALTIGQLYVCGGGAFNTALMQRLRTRLPNVSIIDTGHLGIDPQHVEAVAFAWLARQSLLGRPGNHPSVTHARSATVLGSILPSNENPPGVC